MTKLQAAITLLRFLLVALFGALVMFQAVILPGSFGYMAEESPEHAHLKWPLLAVSILGLLCAQVVIVCTWRLLTMVEDDRIFTEQSEVWANAIVVAIGAAWVLLAGLFLYVTPQLNDPGYPVLMMMMLLSGAGFGFLMIVMRALLRRATVLRTAVEAMR
jgi:hypothetical protein